jgi:hypothetical protein
VALFRQLMIEAFTVSAGVSVMASKSGQGGVQEEVEFSFLGPIGIRTDPICYDIPKNTGFSPQNKNRRSRAGLPLNLRQTTHQIGQMEFPLGLNP